MSSLLFFRGGKNLVYPIAVAIVKLLKVSGNQIKNKDLFRLFWAPDAGADGQFLATTTSITPTDETSWSTPVKLTTSAYGGNSWWDFWPQPFTTNGVQYLFYTSERNATATDRIDGNIWLLQDVFNIYLPLVQR